MGRRNLGPVVRIVTLFAVAAIGYQVMERRADAIPTYPCCGSSLDCSGCLNVGVTEWANVGTNSLLRCSFSHSVPPNSNCWELDEKRCVYVTMADIYGLSDCRVKVAERDVEIIRPYCNTTPKCP